MSNETFVPLRGKIFVTELDEGVHRTAGGIIIQDDIGSAQGIRPRWGKVAVVAPDIDYVEVGEWVLIAHGRWTQRLKVPVDGQVIELWMIEPDAILLVSDQHHGHERIKL